MKRILLAVVAVVAALSVAGASTLAWWTDSVTVTDNIIQTGTADLDVSIDGGTTWSDSKNSPLLLTGLIPGAAATSGYSFTLVNNSSAGLTFQVTGRVTGSTITPDPGVGKAQLMIELYNTTNNVVEVAEIPLTTWEGGAQTFTTTIPASSSKDYTVRARLLGTALNEWQGQTVTYEMTVVGTSI